MSKAAFITEVLLIEKTNVIEAVIDKKAAWFKIRCLDEKEGFVFSGFLKPKKDNNTDKNRNDQNSDNVLIVNKIKYNIRKIVTHPNQNHFRVILLTNENS